MKHPKNMVETKRLNRTFACNPKSVYHSMKGENIEMKDVKHYKKRFQKSRIINRLVQLVSGTKNYNFIDRTGRFYFKKH